MNLVANPEADPFHGRDWPTAGQISIVGGRNDALIAPAHNFLNAARTVCVVRRFCGKGGFPGGGFYRPWQAIVNVPGSTSSTHPTKLIVSLSENDAMPLTSFNDVAAHEIGHVMDFVYAGDRDLSAGLIVESVAEALADMFAYDYNRGDATAFEESGKPARNWANPAALSECDSTGCFPYPAHMRDFDQTPTSRHFNSIILSHAYYLFVKRVGHNVAGDVLQYIPHYLSPRPSYQEVRNGFVARAAQLHPADGPDPGTGSDIAQAAGAAFSQVGLTGLTPGAICIPCLGNR